MSVYHPIFSQSDNADLASAIGDVILAWNAVEYDQVAMMAAMLGIPFDRASQLYHQIPNFRGRTQVLLALVGCTEGFEELKPFIAKYSKLSKTRNEIVHGAFIQQFDDEGTGDVEDVRCLHGRQFRLIWNHRNGMAVSHLGQDCLQVSQGLAGEGYIPATLFVTTDIVQLQKHFWWDELEHIILGEHSLPQVLQVELDGKFSWSLNGDSDWSKERRQAYSNWSLLEKEQV